MKITPITKRGQIGATSFSVTFTDSDALWLSILLSYARRAGLDHMHPSERRRAESMLQRLAAACEAVNLEADTHLEEHTKDYYSVMKAFGVEREAAP